MMGRMFMLSLVCVRLALAQETTNGTGSMAALEAELAANVLVQENETLQEEVALLREQVAQLTVSLAEAVAELDIERSALRGGAAGENVARDAGIELDELVVVDVNPALKMVVFSGGSAKGVKPGLTFTVVRDRASLARVRTIDVRENISGAVIEQVSAGKFPEKGDRVLLAR